MKRLIKTISLLIIAISIQGCSWIHAFQIKNSTNSTWEIEYNINDIRGVIGNRIYLEGNRSKENTIKEFTGYHVRFSLKPNETATIGSAMNSTYGAYKNQRAYHEEAPWIDFMNVDTLVISNNQDTFKLDTRNLGDLLDKNSYRRSRISIKKLIKRATPKP